MINFGTQSSGSQLDLFNPDRPLVPPPGRYHVRILRHEHIPAWRGLMRRLVAEITRGPHACALAYKPLTDDVRGIAWLEHALLDLCIELPKAPFGQMVTACLNALVGVEALATVYHYPHAEGVFVTIRTLHREDRS